VLDESTMVLKGRISFKCYNPQKPTKWGLRVYVIAESETSYISAFEPYFGQVSTNALIRSDLPFTCRIVVHLISRLLQDSPAKGRHLFTDRFYSSPQSCRELRDVHVNTTGTVVSNRQRLPVEVSNDHKENYFTK